MQPRRKGAIWSNEDAMLAAQPGPPKSAPAAQKPPMPGPPAGAEPDASSDTGRPQQSPVHPGSYRMGSVIAAAC